MSILVWLLRMWLMGPVQANAYAAGDDVRMRVFLDRTCIRESGGCRRISIHEIDAWATSRVYKKAVRRGWLDPDRCPFHRPGPGWSTRGHLGQMAAYSWPHLPAWLWCAPPSIMDIPVVGAIAARNRARHLCRKKRACSFRARTRHWRGGEQTMFAIDVTESEMRAIEDGLGRVSRDRDVGPHRRAARQALSRLSGE